MNCSRRSQTGWVALTLMLSTIVAQIGWSQENELSTVSKEDRMATRIVTTLMQRDHLLRRTIDDTVAQNALGLFLKGLDPMKVYFLKSDIDEFHAAQDQIDNEIKEGSFTTAFTVFNRFRKRVDESVLIAHKWLAEQHDFSIDEDMETDRDLIEYAADAQELDDRWRRRVKYMILVEQGVEDAKDDPIERLKRRYSMYAKRMHQMDGEDVVEMFITAVTNTFDPHTSYMSKRTFENFMIQMRLELEGIGATLSANDDGYTVIKRIVPKGAADRQGQLAVEDRIVAVGPAPGKEMVDVIGMKLDDVVGMIRGKAGSVVRLAVLKENGSEIQNIDIVREKIKLEDEAAHGAIFEEGTKADGSPLKIGVIDLPSFYSAMDSEDSASARSTTVDVAKILKDFNDQNVDALVLDLRFNGGGSLTEAVDCTGLFIDAGPVVQVKDHDGSIRQLNDERSGMSWQKPLVVLTSKLSASASEILAGAVKDYGRGLIIGDSTTHGKGTVQSLINLNQMAFRSENPPNFYGALKITMQQFYRPDGDSTQKRGVFSDIVLPSIYDKMDVAETDLEFAVEFDRVPEASHVDMNLATAETIEALTSKSQARIAASDEFQREIRRIQKYVEYKDEKSVSLNKEKFMARRKEFDAEKEDKTLGDQANRAGNKIERKFYLDEVIRITADYAKAVGAG